MYGYFQITVTQLALKSPQVLRTLYNIRICYVNGAALLDMLGITE